MLTRNRTTARGVLLLTVTTLALTAGAIAAPLAKSPRIVFPVIGESRLTASYGDGRGQGSHQGEDIMAPRKATVVAAEAGTVKFHTTSARAGCMLYLYGASGTTYLYIHLNNDLTKENDNRGTCVPGVAYWPGLASGDRVEAGEPIGYNGDSGDANAAGPHLHFEIHPGGGGSVDPYPHLVKAERLLFAAQLGSKFSLALNGAVAEVGGASLTLHVDQLRFWPGSLRLGKVERPLVISMPPTAFLQRQTAIVGGANDLDRLRKGQKVVVFTEAAELSAEARRGDPGALVAERVLLSG